MNKIIILLILGVFNVQSLIAQDSISHKFQVDSVHTVKIAGIKTKILPSSIAPAILIGYGLTTIGYHGLYSSRQARTDLLNFTKGRGSHIDNYLQFAPYLEFGGLLLLRVKCKNDVLNTALLIAKSEILMELITQPIKFIAHEQRPYSVYESQPGNPKYNPNYNPKSDAEAYLSMPSGHTAEAFVAATILYREYRYRSIWYGIGAYALATTVGVFRMINDQHWESDVLVGAGIGILSTNLVYATHIHRWGRKEICVTPTYNGYSKGLAIGYTF